MMLVTGAAGQVGTALVARVTDALTPGRDLVDLSRPAGLAAAVDRLHPTAIVNCAAYTAVDAAHLLDIYRNAHPRA